MPLSFLRPGLVLLVPLALALAAPAAFAGDPPALPGVGLQETWPGVT